MHLHYWRRKSFIILGIGIVLGLGSCQTNKDEARHKRSIDKEKPFEYLIPESEIAFSLPGEFKKVSIPQYKKLIKDSDFSDDIKEDQFDVLDKMIRKYPNGDILLDTINLQNLIFIMRSGPHIRLTKETSKLAVQVMSMNNTKQEKIVEQKFVAKKRFSYIKLKVKQSYISGERYFTHYLLSTHNKSLSITFMNKEGLDFQDYVNMTKVMN